MCSQSESYHSKSFTLFSYKADTYPRVKDGETEAEVKKRPIAKKDNNGQAACRIPGKQMLGRLRPSCLVLGDTPNRGPGAQSLGEADRSLMPHKCRFWSYSPSSTPPTAPPCPLGWKNGLSHRCPGPGCFHRKGLCSLRAQGSGDRADVWGPRVW